MDEETFEMVEMSSANVQDLKGFLNQSANHNIIEYWLSKYVFFLVTCKENWTFSYVVLAAANYKLPIFLFPQYSAPDLCFLIKATKQLLWAASNKMFNKFKRANYRLSLARAGKRLLSASKQLL